MQTVKIIDREFNLLGEIDDYESLMFTRSWTGLGSFEMRINVNKANAQALQKENIVFLTPHKAGVILYREISTEDNEQLIIKGHSLKTYIGRKITEPPTGTAYDYKNDYAENIIKHYVDANCVNPVNPKRQVPGLTIALTQNRGQKIQFQTRYKNLAEEAAKICEVSGLGWNVYLDFETKEFVFEVYDGRNLTAGQDILPPVIFSLDYDNISSQRLTDSSINYRGTAYVGGQGEGVDRSIEVLGDEAEGLDRFEVFVDARDIEDDTMLTDRGLQKLEDYKEVVTFDNDILTQSNVVYGKDYDLGDIVTAVNHKWGVTLNARITEITEIYEIGGFKLNVVFGNNVPTLVDKIKQELDTPLVEKGDLTQGEPGAPGADGTDGIGLDYAWQGTQLGVKREDETNFEYSDLKGPKGDKGDTGAQGSPGQDGAKGDKGEQGIQGPPGSDGYTPIKGVDYFDGAKGDKGDKGDAGSDANVTNANVLDAIGYTPVNRAGDNMTGPLKVNGNEVWHEGNLEVGGRNLAQVLDILKWTGITQGVDENGDYFRYSNANLKNLNLFPSVQFEENTRYTLTFTAKTEGSEGHRGRFGIKHTDGTSITRRYDVNELKTYVIISDKNKTVSEIFHTYEESDYNRLYNIKLEKGTIPTDWSPAPEDIQEQIDLKADKSQVLTDVPANAKFTDTVYTHPASHPPGIIAQDASNRFVTDTEKATWNGKEPAFSKNTAFNKNFGTASGTVCQGNDSRLSNARTPTSHTHTKSQITDMPTKLSQFTNDIGAGAGLNIVASPTEPPQLNEGDWWYKEV